MLSNNDTDIYSAKKKRIEAIRLAYLTNNVNLPQVISEPEALEIISKYSLLNRFGTGYTWQTIDDIPYLDYVYIQKCIEFENKAAELNNRGGVKVVG